MSGGAVEKAAPRAAPLALERILARARAAGEEAVAFAEDRPIAGAALAEAVDGFAAALISSSVCVSESGRLTTRSQRDSATAKPPGTSRPR